MLDKRVVVGYDLGDCNSQISYYSFENDEPETITTVTGGEQFNIPTALCKQNKGGQWVYGKEAFDYKQEGNLVTNLLSLAEKEATIIVGEDEFSPCDLLVLFIKKSLTLLTTVIGNRKIEALAFVVVDLNPVKAQLLDKVIAELKLKINHITYYGKDETFFSYMLHQEIGLWKEQVAICDITEGRLSIMRLEMNQRTVPIVAFIEKIEYDEIDFTKVPKTVVAREEFLKKKDLQLSEILEGLYKKYKIPTLYLIGDDFRERWYSETLQGVGTKMRIFQGNNMFSKGACYFAMDEVVPSAIMKKYVFLGLDKIKCNVGMKVIKNGQEVYLVIVDGGQNWNGINKEFDIILDEDNKIVLQITPLKGGDVKTANVILTGIPIRPKKASRVNITIEFISECRMMIRVKDKGFGEFYPSSHLEWTEEIDIT